MNPFSSQAFLGLALSANARNGSREYTIGVKPGCVPVEFSPCESFSFPPSADTALSVRAAYAEEGLSRRMNTPAPILVLDAAPGVSEGLSERLRRQFNIAIAEVEYQDQWQRAQLAVVMVNTNWRMLQSSMSKLTEYIDRDRRVEITNTETRQLC